MFFENQGLPTTFAMQGQDRMWYHLHHESLLQGIQPGRRLQHLRETSTAVGQWSLDSAGDKEIYVKHVHMVREREAKDNVSGNFDSRHEVTFSFSQPIHL